MRQVSRLTSAVSFATILLPHVCMLYWPYAAAQREGSLNGRCCEAKLPSLWLCVSVCHTHASSGEVWREILPKNSFLGDALYKMYISRSHNFRGEGKFTICTIGNGSHSSFSVVWRNNTSYTREFCNRYIYTNIQIIILATILNCFTRPRLLPQQTKYKDTNGRKYQCYNIYFIFLENGPCTLNRK
jgi:hypothetical protein